jgi:mRNA interferase MazF
LGGVLVPWLGYESVATAALTERLGRLSDQRMREVCAALEVATRCDP